MKKMRVAIIGQGRSGHDIHGKFFLSPENDKVQVVAVVDKLADRREKAKQEFGCDCYETYQELFDRKDIDLVVNASFSQMHYAISRDLICHGFSVLSEKPFGATYLECMDLIACAKQHGVTVAAFHQSLYNPMFKKLKEIIAEGRLGNVYQFSMKYSGFARRWDWQTLQACCAGSVYNSGPHPIGQALDLLGWDENTEVAFSKLNTILTSGDAEDYGKIILTAPNKPIVDIEVNSSDAFAGDFTFKVFGSKGTLLCGSSDYKMKFINTDELEPRPVIREPLADANGKPIYCSEKLNMQEERGTVTGSAFTTAVKEYYDMLYDTVINGAPLAIQAEHAAQVIRIIETCHAHNPLPLKYTLEV